MNPVPDAPSAARGLPEPVVAPSQRLDEIDSPGAYVCLDTGDMIRVTPTGDASRDIERLAAHAAQPVRVTQISDDPFIPISRARVAAANLDLNVHF